MRVARRASSARCHQTTDSKTTNDSGRCTRNMLTTVVCCDCSANATRHLLPTTSDVIRSAIHSINQSIRTHLLHIALYVTNESEAQNGRDWTDVDCGQCQTVRFLRATAGTAIARLSHRNSVRSSVCLSVTRVDQAKTVQARIIKSSPSAAPKTLGSGSVTLSQKFHRGHPNRGP